MDDDDFRIERHVEVVSGAGGDREHLLAVAEAVLACRFDHRHPPWKLVLVDELDCSDVGLVVVLDHVLADGLGGIALMTALLDPGPAAAIPWEPAPPPGLVDVALDRVRGWWKAVLRGLQLLFRPGEHRSIVAGSVGRTRAALDAWRRGARHRAGCANLRERPHRHRRTLLRRDPDRVGQRRPRSGSRPRRFVDGLRQAMAETRAEQPVGVVAD